MSVHHILAERRTAPQLPKPEEIDFRLIGQLLSRKPWVPGLFLGKYSFADHLLTLAEIVPPEFKLEALLFFAHSAFDEPIMPMMEEKDNAHRFTMRIRPIGQVDPFINSVRATIRIAAGLDRHPTERGLAFLMKAQSAVMQAELRDMTIGLGKSVYCNAAITKQPIMPRQPESAATLWADRVEQHIPERMAARNPERVAS